MCETSLEAPNILHGTLADQFIAAVKPEYAANPELLNARMKTLASMVFFSAPEVKTDESVGKITPFHGMDEAAFEGLMRSEDFVFSHHMQVNGGSPNGVRPFSVCETTFMSKIAKKDCRSGVREHALRHELRRLREGLRAVFARVLAARSE
jgi:hypothetical protein